MAPNKIYGDTNNLSVENYLQDPSVEMTSFKNMVNQVTF